ncbi:pyridoxamine 5'-phosphate oxidase family protein [Candidatus Woesearchaeota archaeon]|nr:pyridoxamine 5'-phosphate oxidase family protein [Candidatus Woesearchaeota archaeon]
MIWKDAFKEGNEIVLTTASKTGVPRAIVVSSLGFSKDKLLIGICQMKKSFENLKENPAVSLVAIKHKEYYMITGKTEIFSSGKYFEIAVERSRKCPPIPHHVLVIDIKEVFDLDKIKKIL